MLTREMAWHIAQEVNVHEVVVVNTDGTITRYRFGCEVSNPAMRTGRCPDKDCEPEEETGA